MLIKATAVEDMRLAASPQVAPVSQPAFNTRSFSTPQASSEVMQDSAGHAQLSQASLDNPAPAVAPPAPLNMASSTSSSSSGRRHKSWLKNIQAGIKGVFLPRSASLGGRLDALETEAPEDKCTSHRTSPGGAHRSTPSSSARTSRNDGMERPASLGSGGGEEGPMHRLEATQLSLPPVFTTNSWRHSTGSKSSCGPRIKTGIFRTPSGRRSMDAATVSTTASGWASPAEGLYADLVLRGGSQGGRRKHLSIPTEPVFDPATGEILRVAAVADGDDSGGDVVDGGDPRVARGAPSRMGLAVAFASNGGGIDRRSSSTFFDKAARADEAMRLIKVVDIIPVGSYKPKKGNTPDELPAVLRRGPNDEVRARSGALTDHHGPHSDISISHANYKCATLLHGGVRLLS